MRAPYYDKAGKPIDMWRWAALFEQPGYKRIAQHKYRNIEVSTVWLGVDHGFGYSDQPIIFETMVFRNGRGHEMNRYYTEAEAIEGHRDMVREVGIPMREAGTWVTPLPGVFAVACPQCWTIPARIHRPKGRGPKTIRYCPDCCVRWRQGIRAPRPARRVAWQ